jgi:hypothetical protein
MALRRRKENNNGEDKAKRLTLQQLREARSMLSFIRPYRWYFTGGLILLFFGSVIFMAFP